MRALVTGAAGFIGSHLTERLLAEGTEVIAVDSFTDYYPRWMKERNLEAALSHPGCQFIEGDLVEMALKPLLEGVDYVFHQAAQAGVRASWGATFQVYTSNNILATQRLLEACVGTAIRKFVYASSSSIYGDAETYPTSEEAQPRPVSPYGVTKLAGEHLCYLYWRNFGVPVAMLRYFTAYGPRQRPDMAFHKFIRALLLKEEIQIYGDGLQSRDFTYVGDVVTANLLAAQCEAQGLAFNIGGGSRVPLMNVLGEMEDVLGVKASIRHIESQPGDARHTAADISRARSVLGYTPTVSIREGLEREAAWLKQMLA